MATQACRLMQDQNLNDNIKGGGRHSISTAQKKVGLGVRKALTDLTNSRKPSSPNQATKKGHSKNLNPSGEKTSICKPANISKPVPSVGEKLKTSIAQEKDGLGGRKALGDLTNSANPILHQTSKKNCPKKLNVIAEEEFFLHNHQECINSRRAMEMDFFLRTMELDDDFSMQIASPIVSRHAKAESPPKRRLDLEEIPDLADGYQSPPPCRTPESLSASSHKDYFPSPNLKLKGTPE
ncbi:PREDICTED: uncharacterized protein LOC104610653 [Nelumbo nucifera]|uniref:Uncharacterized protein LOC104610653 n=1 Tax=Nelumbo nucifera TaxID=4432 RepID=A0A1U8B4D8_NELNU|nr:PREDICTED: uncharacterized protein LOC104610653 [Nelumbo nucifera]XP_010275689.1 PREDICTED: uncharacterized protein LOC104610653 [Nelumbo nucifera]